MVGVRASGVGCLGGSGVSRFGILVISAVRFLHEGVEQRRPDLFPLRVLYWSTPDIAEILGRAAKGRRYKSRILSGMGRPLL